MKNDLIGRYIYAVTRHLPKKNRDDIEKELDGLIAELLEARCGESSPTDKDIKIVLMELGSPEEMAAKYSGDEKQSLISGMYYLVYKKILKLVLPIVMIVVFFTTLVSNFIDWEMQKLIVFIPKIIGQSVGGSLASAIQAFAVITIIFIILERKNVDFGEEDFLSLLPQVPKNESRIKMHESIFDMVCSVIVGALLLLCPQIIGAWSEGTGWISAFNTDVVKSMWYLIVLWVVFEMIREIVTIIEGCYTKRLAIMRSIANILIAIPMCIFFSNDSLLDIVFIEKISELFNGNEAEVMTRILQNVNIFILGIALIALIGSTAMAFFKAWKYSREG